VVHQHGPQGLRANALRDIKQVKWTPEWGEQRITGMIENRPDWCLSRQRTWGVPITLFTHKAYRRAASAHAGIHRAAAARVERDGIDAWFALDAAELLGAEAALREGTDVMDVWADSGCRSNAWQRCAMIFTRRWICTWKARTSIAAGSTARC
jgi:isoleucyl-tRNA synthetase